jgi:tetratricopeptide (TPR) repeat protein
MRKLTFSVLLCMVAFSAFSQKKVVRQANSAMKDGKYKDALQLINQALENPETANDANTWYVKGKIFQGIGESKDTAISKLVENPLEKAFDTYKKAIEIDPKMQKDVNLMLMTLNNSLLNSAIESFNAKKYEKALLDFEYNLDVNAMPVFKGSVDTAVIYNAGLAASNSKQWDKAINYYTKAKEYNYGGSSPYILLKNAYLAKGDTAKAEAVLQEGFTKYNKDINVIVELVNYYITANQAKKALDYLSLAKQSDPSNVTFYFAEGTLYEKMGESDKALESYKTSIEKDPKYFNGYYNIGVLYYNKAVKMYDVASNTKDNNEYERLKKLADQELTKSIPWMEQAHQIDPKEASTKETLKNLYFRMRTIEPDKDADWNAKYKAMKAEIDDVK